jgi:hypothetical protein
LKVAKEGTKMDPDLVALKWERDQLPLRWERYATFQTPWICPMNRALYIKQQRACLKRGEPLQFSTVNTVLTTTERVLKL